MTYKIVRTVYETDRFEFQTYVKKFMFGLIPHWQGISREGQEWMYADKCKTNEEAEKAMRLHKEGNYVKKKIYEKFYE